MGEIWRAELIGMRKVGPLETSRKNTNGLYDGGETIYANLKHLGNEMMDKAQNNNVICHEFVREN